MGKLEGKIALITGGNSGIGLATAKQFVNEGAYVFITGRREPELAAAVKEIGKNVTGIQGDVSNLGDLDRLFAQSGFANTDLDHQLKEHGIEKIIIIGMVANTCIESTGRFGMELGYHVTFVKDATAAFSREAMHAAHEINGPTFAHAILTTSELVAALSKA